MAETAPAQVAPVATSVVTDAMRGVIGKELKGSLSWPISASDIRKWAVAVYFPEKPPARFCAESGMVAPEEFNPFAISAQERYEGPPDVSASFIERLAGVAPPPVEVILNGGELCTYGVPMREGDVIRSSLSIASYAEKQGKRTPLLLTVMRTLWTNQRGEMVKTSDMTLIRY